MAGPTPLIWHVTPPGIDPTDEVRSRASARGWQASNAQCVRLTSGRGRISNVLQRRDAAQIYEDMHRRPVAVVYEGKIVVRTDPRPPFRDNRVLSLFEFCRYKSSVSSLHPGAADWESTFDEWLENPECDGRDDPRILPLHVFSSKGTYDLNDIAARRRFRQSHTLGRALVDKHKRTWSSARPGARHGREPQTVRGLRLDVGFHWDVKTASDKLIMSSNMIWRIQSGGYINIYPDGHTRTGKRCQLIWKATHSAIADDNERNRDRSR